MGSSSTKKRKTVRNYQQDFLLLGFYLLTADSEKPECVDCGLIMTNDSIKKSKLLAHQQVEHPSSVEKSSAILKKNGVTAEAHSKIFRFPLKKGKR